MRAGKSSRPSGSHKRPLCLAPFGKYRHTSQSQIPSPVVRGSKTGLVIRRPFAFCCLVGCAVSLPVEAWSLRGLVYGRSAFDVSRQRHGTGMNQVRLHRHATAAVCGSCASTKKPCRTKTPAPDFSLPHTTLRVRFGRCALCLIVPARPACQAARGRAALLLSRSPATLPVRPKWLPEFNKT